MIAELMLGSITLTTLVWVSLLEKGCPPELAAGLAAGVFVLFWMGVLIYAASNAN